MGSSYERELKGILAGDDDVLRRTTRSLDPGQEKGYRWTETHPFLVVRGAGSLGVDLVALRHDLAFPIEVKASSEDTVRFSDSSGAYQEQAEEMMRACERSGLVPLYAFRLKGHVGDAWRVFTLPLDPDVLPGKSRILHRRIPPVPVTGQGNYVLRWDEGLPLNGFFAYLAHIKG